MTLPPAAKRRCSAFARSKCNTGARGMVVGSFRLIQMLAILSIAGVLVDVESFLPTSPSRTASPRVRIANPWSFPIEALSCDEPAHPCHCRHWNGHGPTAAASRVMLRASEDGTTPGGFVGVVESIGLASQPIVWISLCSLATTGHGLPAGPGGFLGGLEGIAYLVVLARALVPTHNAPSLARTLSRVSIGLGLLVLAGVAAQKGCVPNAKPILDYSAYLPVCSPEP